LTAIFIGYFEEVTFGFAFILISSIYTPCCSAQARAFSDHSALLARCYFSFFALPFMEHIGVFEGYQLLGASLLLLIPDLFLSPDFSTNKTWRWPLRILGALLALFNLALILPTSMAKTGDAALAYGVYAIFFAAYALRYNKAWLGYIATSSAALAVTFALQHFELDAWLLTLTAMSALYYLAGFILGRNENRTAWSNMLRYSGLGLASLVSLLAVVTFKESGGWYALITALLFGIEIFSRKNILAEAGLQLFFASWVFVLLRDAEVERGYQGLGIALACWERTSYCSRLLR
jgi:hypothetical protein